MFRLVGEILPKVISEMKAMKATMANTLRLGDTDSIIWRKDQSKCDFVKYEKFNSHQTGLVDTKERCPIRSLW